ncbi:MAG: MFS transporter [Thermoplasmatota archaeon]
MASVGRVVGTYYTLTGLFTLSASLIWGVNTLFLLDAGLTIFQAFAANAAYTAGMVVFEIPTGVVADTRGRRLSFLLAIATLLAGTLAYMGLASLDAAPFSWWLAASVLLGLGFTFYSGAVEAWFVDALGASDGGEAATADLEPYFARNGQVASAAMIVGTIGGGALGTLHLSLPFAGRAVLLAALLVAGFFFLHDQGFKARPFQVRRIPQEVAAIGQASWRHGWSNRPVRLLMMLSFLHHGFLIWGWYAWQPYFLDLLGKELVWVAGVIAALVSLAMMAGGQVVRVLHGRLDGPTLMAIGTTGVACAMICVGLVGDFVGAVAAFLVGMVFFGALGPVKQAALHRLIPSKQRATILSFDGLLGSAGGVGSQLGLARLAEDRGYAAGYVVGGAALLLGIPVAMLYRKCGPASLQVPEESRLP